MNTGMTIKQHDIYRFFKVLDLYRQALESGTKQEIIQTSLAIQYAKGQVPKRFHKLVNRTFKETKRIAHL